MYDSKQMVELTYVSGTENKYVFTRISAASGAHKIESAAKLLNMLTKYVTERVQRIS